MTMIPPFSVSKNLVKPPFNQLINDELPIKVKALEHFVCCVYSSTSPTSLPLLRWELFRSKILEGDRLPPTRAALLPHIIRANYVTMRDKSYFTDYPELPSIEENGWHLLASGCYIPVKCLALPVPKPYLNL